MNNLLDNLVRLYSLDDQICYKALLDKKDWMFRKLYVPVSFEKTIVDNKDLYLELYALMDQSFIFQKLAYEKVRFGEENFEHSLELIKSFNDKYRVLYLQDQLDYSALKDTFFVELDMTKIDDKVYRDLVANFYPTVSDPHELDIVYQNEMLDLLKLPMVSSFPFVFILQNDMLIDNKYFLPVVKALHYTSSLSHDKIEAIKEIGQNLEVKVIMDE